MCIAALTRNSPFTVSEMILKVTNIFKKCSLYRCGIWHVGNNNHTKVIGLRKHLLLCQSASLWARYDVSDCVKVLLNIKQTVCRDWLRSSSSSSSAAASTNLPKPICLPPSIDWWRHQTCTHSFEGPYSTCKHAGLMQINW